MSTKSLVGAAVLTGLLVIVSMPALAHHGSRASYDMEHMVAKEGVVTEFDWTNPHVFFFFDVTDDKGIVTHWAAESDPPSLMARRYGWNKNFLKPGDEVTVTVWPSKVGSPRGFLAKLVRADGTVTDHTAQTPPE